jgi:hypothetical protein
MRYKFKIAEPCAQDWVRMHGNARERYCGECKLHVHNFADMTTLEIEALVRERKGERICGRIERRADGRLVTADLAAIEAAGMAAFSARVPALAGAALTAVLSFASAAAGQTSPSAGATASGIATIQHSEPDDPPAITVLDPSGAPVAKATMVLTNRETKALTAFTSDAHGRFVLGDVASASYDIDITSAGFANVHRAGVALPASTTIAMQLAPSNDPVTVEETGRAAVQTGVGNPAKAAAAQHGRAITVLDQSGSPIPNAKATLTNRKTKEEIQLVGDAGGRVPLNGVPHADYDIQITAPGFHTENRDDVAMPANAAVTLGVGAIMGVIVVDDPNRNPVKHLYNKIKTWL